MASPPSQTGDDGDPLPAVLIGVDAELGDALDVDSALVVDAIAVHKSAAPVEPLTDGEIIRLRALLAAAK